MAELGFKSMTPDSKDSVLSAGLFSECLDNHLIGISFKDGYPSSQGLLPLTSPGKLYKCPRFFCVLNSSDMLKTLVSKELSSA